MDELANADELVDEVNVAIAVFAVDEVIAVDSENEVCAETVDFLVLVVNVVSDTQSANVEAVALTVDSEDS